MAGYRSNFHVTKIPMAITATTTSIQSWLDEKPNTVASRTNQSDIGVPSKREGTITRLHRPYVTADFAGLTVSRSRAARSPPVRASSYSTGPP
jgi:hypothetical protein